MGKRDSKDRDSAEILLSSKREEDEEDSLVALLKNAKAKTDGKKTAATFSKDNDGPKSIL